MHLIARRTPFHYAWLSLLASILGNTVAGGSTFWAVAVYIPAIADDFDVPRFPVVAAFMTGQFISALIGAFVGRWVDRHGARGALLAGSALVPLMLVATAQATNIWQLFVGWSLVSAARALLMPIPYNWLLTRWFEGRRQAALGVATVGFGLGGATVLPLVAAIESQAGWRPAMVMSAALLLVVHGLLALLVVRDRPVDLGLAMEGAAGGQAPLSAESEGGFTASGAARSPVFWLLAFGMMFFFLGQGAVATLAIDFFDSRVVAGGATIVAVSALLRTVMRLPLGLSLSRVDRVFRLALAVVASQAIALAILTLSTSAAAVWTWVAIWGIGGAFAPMLEPLLITRSFGVRHFGAVSGLMAVVAFGGQTLGPIGGAALFDATGSYDLSFALYVAGFAVAFALFAATSLALRSGSFRAAADRAGMRRPRR